MNQKQAEAAIRELERIIERLERWQHRAYLPVEVDYDVNVAKERLIAILREVNFLN